MQDNLFNTYTIFPRIIAVPRLIASLEQPHPPPTPRLEGNNENIRLPLIIFQTHPSRHLLFLLSPPCQVEVESDPAKLIIDDSSSSTEDIDTEN